MLLNGTDALVSVRCEGVVAVMTLVYSRGVITLIKTFFFLKHSLRVLAPLKNTSNPNNEIFSVRVDRTVHPS